MGLTVEGAKRVPVEVVPGAKVVDIASGADHLVLLTQSGNVYTIGLAEQGQLGRVPQRACSGESRRGKTQLLQPGLIIIKGKTFVADGIWTTTYCTFMREHGTSSIFGFGLNNYNQLGLKTPPELVGRPTLTSFTNVRKIVGKHCGTHSEMISNTH